MSLTLIQKFKHFTNATEDDKANFIRIIENHGIVHLPNFFLCTDDMGYIELEIVYRKRLSLFSFREEMMHVLTSTSYSNSHIDTEDRFDLPYDAGEDFLFQLSTIHNIGFIEECHVKYLKLINEMYSPSVVEK